MPEAPTAILGREGVRLAQRASDKEDALRQSGALLVELGAVEPGYAPAMLEREKSVSTYLGEGVAIPHGTDEARSLVKRTTLGVLQFPEGVDWGEATVNVCIAIAASGEEHVGILAGLAGVLVDPEKAERLRNASTEDEVLELLAPGDDDED